MPINFIIVIDDPVEDPLQLRQRVAHLLSMFVYFVLGLSARDVDVQRNISV